jgi:hypothetical protein
MSVVSARGTGSGPGVTGDGKKEDGKRECRSQALWAVYVPRMIYLASGLGVFF